MQKIILLTCLVAVSFATFHINLEETKLDEHLTVVKPKSGNVAAKSMTVDTTQTELLYTYKTKLGEEETSVFFDTTADSNYQYKSDGQKIDGKDTVSAGSERTTLEKASKTTIEGLNIDDNTLKSVEVEQSTTLSAKANADVLTQGSSFGLALNRLSYEKQNFFNTLQANDVKFEKEGRGFSFYFSEKINQLFFGKEQEFFAEGDLEEINISDKTKKQWSLPLSQNGVSLNEIDNLSQKDPQYVVFDTTTRYIWVYDQLITSITSSLNQKSFVCTQYNKDNHGSGLYKCTKPQDQEFPTLRFQFTKTSEDPDYHEKSKTYEVSNYVQHLDGDEYLLLIRGAANYKKGSIENKDRIPSQNLSSTTDYRITLGTVFLENVYTYFSYDNNSISLAQSQKIQPEGLGIPSDWQTWFLVLGVLGCLGAIAFTLSTLTQVPYKQTEQVVLPQPVAQPVVQAPQQVAQSYVKTTPVYYVQNQSPQRFVRSIPQQYQPQPQYYQQRQ